MCARAGFTRRRSYQDKNRDRAQVKKDTAHAYGTLVAGLGQHKFERFNEIVTDLDLVRLPRAERALTLA